MLRGNVDTRLRKLDEGQYDAIVLAAAGLRRLGWAGPHSRADSGRDHVSRRWARARWRLRRVTTAAKRSDWSRKLDHAAIALAVTAERALLATLGGGCQVPIGGSRDGSTGIEVHLRAIVASPDGSRVVRGEASGRGSACASARSWDASCSNAARAKSSETSTRHEGLPGRRGTRRSRSDHRQGPQDPGARRRDPLRSSGERAPAGSRAGARRAHLRRQEARRRTSSRRKRSPRC